MRKYFVWIIIVVIILIGNAIIWTNPFEGEKGLPFDFQSDNFSANAKLIAHDITLYNETEIKDYPLTDLSPEEIKAVFTFLDSGNLSKVLLNIANANIKSIYDKLNPSTFNKIIEEIPETNKNKILKRVS